jgi:ferredoxin
VRLIVDYDSCVASGACVTACPEVFKQGDDGVVVVLDETPSESLRSQVEDAIALCPAMCIELEDEA